MPQLICKQLSLGYGGRPITGNLNFTLSSGDYLCIVGENGAGKSTLLRALLGLSAPLSGEIIFDKALARREIGYLPQQTPLQRDFPASVAEIVRSGCLNHLGFHPFYGKEERKHAESAMRRMNILSLRDRSYRDLSGGQQQRTLLARALCSAQRMLLLDEPASGLDPIAARELYAAIRDLNRESHLTILMVTHNLEDVFPDATHILHVNKDSHFFGTRDEYLESELGQKYLSLCTLPKPPKKEDAP